jgi:hypothetical protein
LKQTYPLTPENQKWLEPWWLMVEQETRPYTELVPIKLSKSVSGGQGSFQKLPLDGDGW